MYSNFLQIMLIAQLTYLITCQEEEKENQVMVRDKRQTYTVYYLCGSPPNNYLSKTPCNNNNNCPSCNPSNCKVRCSTTQYCRNQNRNWTCQSGCCRVQNLPPITTPRPSNPTCEGREVSNGYCQNGRCNNGYFCRNGGVCCRCEFGTSIGSCVNGQCPDNTFCNRNNECCPFQVGK